MQPSICPNTVAMAAPFAPMAGNPKYPNISIGSTTALNSVLESCI